MLWIKSFHIIAMVTWFAGMFYLPRLFVYHAMSEDPISNQRFKVMERKLFFGIMTPGAVVTIGLGMWLLVAGWEAYMIGYWMHLKLALVLVLVAYHIWCGALVTQFKQDNNTPKLVVGQKSSLWKVLSDYQKRTLYSSRSSRSA